MPAMQVIKSKKDAKFFCFERTPLGWQPVLYNEEIISRHGQPPLERTQIRELDDDFKDLPLRLLEKIFVGDKT